MKLSPLAALAAAFFCLQANAGVEVTYNGNVKTITFPSNTIGGSPTHFSVQMPGNVPTSPPPSIPTNQKVGGFGIDKAPAGHLRVIGLGDIPLNQGASKKISPVQIESKIPARNFGKALMIAGKIAWPIGVVMTAGDIYDYLRELEMFDIKNDGTQIKAKIVEDSYPKSDGLQYSINGGATWSNTKESACSASNKPYHAADFPAKNFTVVGDRCHYQWYFPSTPNSLNPHNVGFLTRTNDCPSGNYFTPNGCSPEGKIRELNEQEILDKIASASGWPTSAARALASALNTPGASVQVEPPAVTGPATVKGETTTTTETVNLQPGTTKEAAPGTTSPTQPGTKTTTKTENTNVKYSGNSITTNNNVTNTTVTITNNVTNETNVEGDKTEEVQDTKEPQEIETCGLPGKPACKIDETGTPEPVEDKAKDDTDKAIKPLDDFIKNPKSSLPELPVINWAFTLPSGCSPISLPAFDPWLQEIDICPFQSIFHDIMSIVWVIGGLFGAISIFWRNTFSQGT